MGTLPLRYLIIGQFLGANEGADSLSLADVFGSRCHNLIFDKLARLRSIAGFTPLQATAILPVTNPLTDTAVLCVGLHHYTGTRTTEVGVFAGNTAEWSFRLSDDGGITWVKVAAMIPGGLVTNCYPDFAQIGNLLIIADGSGANVPRQFSGGAITVAGDTDQLAAPTAVASANGGLLTGTYKWKVRPVQTDGTPYAASIKSNTLQLNRGQADLTWASHAGGGYQVWRTTGSGNTYFLEAFIQTGTTAYTSNMSDDRLILQPSLDLHGDAPPATCFCEVSGGRMWYGRRADTFPRRAYFADAGYPMSVGEFSFIDFTDGENWSDALVGMTGDFLGMTVFWMQRQVWTVSGTGEMINGIVDYYPRKTNASIGTATVRTVAKIPIGAIYTDTNGERVKTDQPMLAYMTTTGELRVFDGNSSHIISTPQAETVARLSYIYAGRAHCIHDINRAEVTWMFPGNDVDRCDTAVTWNYRHGVMMTRDWPFHTVALVENANEAHVLLGSESDRGYGGFLYRLHTGDTTQRGTAAAQPLAWEWISAPLYVNGQNRDAVGLPGTALFAFTKRWRWLDALLKNSSEDILIAVDVLEAEEEDGSTPIVSKVLASGREEIEDANANEIEDADDNTLLAVDEPASPRVQLATADGQYVHRKGIRLRLRASHAVGHSVISGLCVAYQLLPGQKRTPV